MKAEGKVGTITVEEAETEAGECKQIFEAIKDMHIPKEIDTKDDGFEYMLDCWRYMTKYCSENKD